MKKTPSLSNTLKQRRGQHGDFTHNAKTTQELKSIIRLHPKFPHLQPIMRESLEMIMHKVGRILSGDETHKDHWHDIAGYATLVEERI